MEEQLVPMDEPGSGRGVMKAGMVSMPLGTLVGKGATSLEGYTLLGESPNCSDIAGHGAAGEMYLSEFDCCTRDSPGAGEMYAGTPGTGNWM
jgi:hypothetical protein